MQRQDDTRQQPPDEDSGGWTQRQTHPAALRGEEHTQLYAQPLRDKPVSAGRTILSPQSGIMLTWPHGGTDWKPYLRQITDTYLELSEIITRYELLLVATPILESTRRMLASRLSPEQMSRVHLYEIESNDTWARDHGPITLVSKHCRNGFIVPIHLLDFRFNGWGEKFAWQKDNAINLQLYYQGAFQAALENHTDHYRYAGASEEPVYHEHKELLPPLLCT